MDNNDAIIFLNLPNELLSHIFSFLPVLSLSNLAQTCKFVADMIFMREFLYNFKRQYNEEQINKIFINGCKARETSLVKFMLDYKLVDPSIDDNYAIQYASENGHIKIVKLLLNCKGIDRSANDDFAIQWAAAKGYTEIVKLLLQDPKVNPSANNSFALKWALEIGHTEIVKLLLSSKRVDLSLTNIDIVSIIRLASKNGHNEIVELLS